jgi:hypothetical protein
MMIHEEIKQEDLENLRQKNHALWQDIARLHTELSVKTSQTNTQKWAIITEALKHVYIKGYISLSEQYHHYYLLNELLDKLASQNGRGTRASMLALVKVVIEKHPDAIFDKNWHHYFKSSYSHSSYAATDQVVENYNYYHTLLYKVLHRKWYDIASLLLPMLTTMQNRGRALLATAFIEHNFTKGLNYFYNSSAERNILAQKYILNSVFASGNWDCFKIVMDRENLNGKNGAFCFENDENPLVWAIRYRRYKMFRYLIENQENKQLIFGHSEDFNLHPVYEAAKIGLFKYFKLALDNYLPGLVLDENGKVNEQDNEILFSAAVKLVENDDVIGLKYLVKKGFNHQDDENYIFMKACSENALECMKYLHSLGVSLNPQGEYAESFWSIYSTSLDAIYYLEKHQLVPQVDIAQILSHQIIEITEPECLRYSLDNATSDDLREALEVYNHSERISMDYYASALKENRAMVLHRLIDMELDIFLTTPETDAEKVNKI